MLFIQPYDEWQNCRTLRHGPDVFHEALRAMIKGEERFHVLGGPEAYDLIYIRNQEWAENDKAYPDSPYFRRNPLYPPYPVYDEQDGETLCPDIFQGKTTVYFEQANEYSIVLTGVLLRFTDLTVMFRDQRILWFCPQSDRLLTGRAPEAEDASVLRVQEAFSPSAFTCDFDTVDAVTLFHSVFTLQWLTDLRPSNIRYAEISVPRSEGIGCILTVYERAQQFFARVGAHVTLKPGSARYSDRMLKKYFTLELTPEDADDGNTIRVVNYHSLLFTYMLRRSGEKDFDASYLNPSFLAEMEEYGDAVFRDRKMLGVLMRGTDYITSDMSGASAPVAVESIIGRIQAWIKEDGYEGIFLATEDSDILRQMRAAFPGKVTAVSQERYCLSDLQEAGVTTLSELEQLRHGNKDYEDYQEDTTVNYFYALYLLSRCEGLMYSGQCGGIVMATGLSDGRIRRLYCFANNRETDNRHSAGP